MSAWKGTVALVLLASTEIAAVAGGGPGEPRSGGAPACVPTTIGVDTTHGNDFCVAYDGGGCGQVFHAADTVIRSITVWRTAQPDSNGTPMKLYVTHVFPDGEPDIDRVLRAGPVLQILAGDGIHPVKFQFVLDPPLQLPGAGDYFFTVQTGEPYCDFGFAVVADSLDPYTAGMAWWNSRTGPIPGCPLGPADLYNPRQDLVFEIEFCDTTTAVRRRTWGELKTLYR